MYLLHGFTGEVHPRTRRVVGINIDKTCNVNPIGETTPSRHPHQLCACGRCQPRVSLFRYRVEALKYPGPRNLDNFEHHFENPTLLCNSTHTCTHLPTFGSPRSKKGSRYHRPCSPKTSHGDRRSTECGISFAPKPQLDDSISATLLPQQENVRPQHENFLSLTQEMGALAPTLSNGCLQHAAPYLAAHSLTLVRGSG